MVAWAGRKLSPPLGEHVLHVVALGSQEKVARIDALGIVAAVQHAIRRFYVSLIQGKRNAMGQSAGANTAALYHHGAIAAHNLVSRPKPTLIGGGNANMRPKPIGREQGEASIHVSTLGAIWPLGKISAQKGLT